MILTLVGLVAVAGDTPLTRDAAISRTMKDIETRLDGHGGVLGIQQTLKPFNEEVQQKVVNSGDRYAAVKETFFQAGITRGNLAPIWPKKAGDDQEGVSGYEAILTLHRELQSLGVDLILVPMPAKYELYAGVFDTPVPDGVPVSTARQEMMLALSRAGVEVVDLLPTLQAALPNAEHPLYEVRGHHLSGLGTRLCGKALAERLARYDFKDRDPARYGFTERKSVERADPSRPMTAYEVTRNGEPYTHVTDGEVIVVGDSQAFAHFGASLASHTAREAGIDITDLSLSSGANWIAGRLAEMGTERLRRSKAVVAIVTGAAFSRMDWENGDFQEKPTVLGMMALGMLDEAEALAASTKNPADIGIDEAYLNRAAYRMAATSQWDQAEATFKINTRFFPNSANAWDSLAEFYARRDRKEEAQEIAVKVMGMNPEPNVRKNALATLRRVGYDTSQWDNSVSLSVEALSAFVGTYELSRDTTLDVVLKEDRLWVRMEGRPDAPMTPTGATSFETPGPNITFKRDGEDMLMRAGTGSDIREGKRIKPSA